MNGSLYAAQPKNDLSEIAGSAAHFRSVLLMTVDEVLEEVRFRMAMTA